MFRRVLIANRGEIALRIVRACRELGVESVVVHSTADRGAPWLEAADESVCVGGPSSRDSYLNQEAILQAALQAECQALHPGYGFLAENATFAARCEQQGLTFVGPRPDSISTMGDKATAKRTMAALGLPVIPGSAGLLADEAAAQREAARIGYPVLFKATAGGGGKGMRLCENDRDVARAYSEAMREARQAFGDPGLYLEKCLQGARHVEFQLLADGFGKAVHLGERECSIQRRHQKLIEEAPSPVVDAAERTALGSRVAEAVGRLGYRGVGTVEFLRARNGQFFFMEMNTRLQVEHPVTEMLTGVDLVAEQLRVAANRPLELVQSSIVLSGHAIELRVNAEDPEDGFRPDPGRIDAFSAPTVDARGVTVRWDSAICEGYRIPPHYDSLIGKLIVHAGDRSAALDAAGRALQSLRVEGVKTTTALLQRILNDPAFRGGDYDIDHLSTSGLLGAGVK